MSAEPLLVETIEAMLTDHCTPERVAGVEGTIDAPLWSLLHDAGLTSVGISEAVGGSGGSRHDLAALAFSAGRHAAPVPLVDHLAACCVLEAAGLELADGPLALGLGHPGRATIRLPWGAAATNTCLVTAAGVHLRPVNELTIVDSGTNYAGEPWSDVDAADVGDADADHGVDGALLIAALVRAVSVAGALDQAAELSVQFAGEREQFGRPIGRFQIIQHHLAQMAGEVVSATAAADEAVDVWAAGGRLDDVVATARVAGGRATALVTRLAHQIHGAIGFTDEHRLHLTTRRLWAWRDERGTDAQWAARLGADVARRGGDALWPSITEWPPAT